jgi:hypothetical protein
MIKAFYPIGTLNTNCIGTLNTNWYLKYQLVLQIPIGFGLFDGDSTHCALTSVGTLAAETKILLQAMYFSLQKLVVCVFFFNAWYAIVNRDRI